MPELDYISCIQDASDRFVSAHPEMAGHFELHARDEEIVYSVFGSDEGFDVHLALGDVNEIIFHAGPIHTHNFQEEGQSPQEFVDEMFYQIRHLLSPLSRIVEHRAGKQSCKWELQYETDGEWETSETMGMLFYNFFAKRSRHIIQNHRIQPPKR